MVFLAPIVRMYLITKYDAAIVQECPLFKKYFSIQILRPLFESGPYLRATVIGMGTVFKVQLWS